MNKKKKSTNLSPYPDEAIERLARAFYPAILACWNSEEGQREFAAWQAEQAHLSGKEKQEVPDGELPALLIVCGFFLLVQTHTPLIVPLQRRRAGKSGFHFTSGARAQMASALHLRLVAR